MELLTTGMRRRRGRGIAGCLTTGQVGIGIETKNNLRSENYVVFFGSCSFFVPIYISKILVEAKIGSCQSSS
jgi:hypothetical protein